MTPGFTNCIQAPRLWLTRLALGTALLAAPAASRADTIYVSNAGGGPNASLEQYVEEYSGGVGTRFSSDGLNWPTGLAFDGAGNLYVASSLGSYTIEKISPAGVGTVFCNSPLLNAPNGVAFDTAGNLYAANYSNHTIVEFTPGGVGSVFASNLVRPQGLAFDSAGNLYMSDGVNNSILKFTPGGVGSLFASSNLNDPFGMAFDSAGNLYAANFHGNSVTEFAPDGSVAGVISSGLNQPTFIAIVPEPASWTLLALGLPALLAWRRGKVK